MWVRVSPSPAVETAGYKMIDAPLSLRLIFKTTKTLTQTNKPPHAQPIQLNQIHPRSRALGTRRPWPFLPIATGSQRIEQLAWLLFLKIMDDKDQEQEILHDDYVSPVP